MNRNARTATVLGSVGVLAALGGGIYLAIALGGTAAASSRPATVQHAAATKAVTSKQINTKFAALAATLPVCGAQVTNCRYGTAATHLEASVQSATVTIYFEMGNGVVTDLEVYPAAH